jgi:hypothetical protein
VPSLRSEGGHQRNASLERTDRSRTASCAHLRSLHPELDRVEAAFSIRRPARLCVALSAIQQAKGIHTVYGGDAAAPVLGFQPLTGSSRITNTGKG